MKIIRQGIYRKCDIYKLRCDACNHEFIYRAHRRYSKLRKMHNEIIICPNCNKHINIDNITYNSNNNLRSSD